MSTEETSVGRIALLGVPFDANSSYLRGPAQAPPLIRQAFHSDHWNYWSEDGHNIGAAEAVFDAGDVQFTSDEKAFAEIEEVVVKQLALGRKPLCLGGDHSVTYPIVRAYAKKYPDLHILLFDAHPDMYDELQGNRLSHACPFARILEEFPEMRMMAVGIRNFPQHQRAQAERFKVKVVEMKDWSANIPLEFSVPIYVSFDLDVLDPACAPGVSHYEPGGFTTREALRMIHTLDADIVGADIVEYNPTRDVNGMTAVVAAKILKELAAKML
ncbi:MAG: agmatinase [Acidobacteria bacterium]|nr:agmatinase [Acidobacteriota bacterium]